FSPQLPITREALATIMHRYHQYINGKQSDMADISFYDDYDKISPWAESSLAWAVQYGLIKGNGDNTLSPHTNATRAQTAAILERYLTGNK
ncbi:MAG: S-layer homology domain-containing protein, partial [Clostridia bacterium]|nr:S-layer homology domain-containing protein [Clostridia bacterium]